MTELEERIWNIETKLKLGFPVSNREKSLYILYAKNPKMELLKPTQTAPTALSVGK